MTAVKIVDTPSTGPIIASFFISRAAFMSAEVRTRPYRHAEKMQEK
jgi:hypothetical protein